MIIHVSGHSQKMAKDLRDAADKIERGQFAFIAVIDEDGGDDGHEIQFNSEDQEFGLEDKPMVEVE